MTSTPHPNTPTTAQFRAEAQFKAAYLNGDTLLAYEPFGGGHIHDTYLATVRRGGARLRFVHQRFNQLVFNRPAVVMANMSRVTDHLRRKQTAQPAGGHDWEALTIVPNQAGALFTRQADDTIWRVFAFVEDSYAPDTLADDEQAFQVGAAFGAFQQLIADLDGPRLSETIPDFHHTPRRFAALDAAIQADSQDRVRRARPEIAFAQAQAGLAPILIDLQAQGAIPERITHNDTKANNVLLSSHTRRWRCVVDLDTVMPGLAPYDFGDMIRIGAATAAEDTTDLSRMDVDLDRFQALTAGYLSRAGALLNPTEKAHLTLACQIITLETGVRFLTDYLQGDVYFKTSRPQHNLERCRAQFKLVAAMQAQARAMAAIVASFGS